MLPPFWPLVYNICMMCFIFLHLGFFEDTPSSVLSGSTRQDRSTAGSFFASNKQERQTLDFFQVFPAVGSEQLVRFVATNSSTELRRQELRPLNLSSCVTTRRRYYLLQPYRELQYILSTRADTISFKYRGYHFFLGSQLFYYVLLPPWLAAAHISTRGYAISVDVWV